MEMDMVAVLTFACLRPFSFLCAASESLNGGVRIHRIDITSDIL